MLRTPLVVGNWKMNLLRNSSLALVQNLRGLLPAQRSVEVAVCPPSVYLDCVSQALQGSGLGLGAQNMHHAPEGAFTGELSGKMLRDIGCQFVILGHSERRQFFGDTNQSVNQKMHAALGDSLTPIVCVGETLDEREKGQTESVIDNQVRGSLAGLTIENAAKIVIAYEPVWAIGTGKTATPEQAEEVHAQIRRILSQLFGTDAAEAIRIQYGGSVKPDNAAELMSQPNIDGALVGGASLQAESFSKICLACCNLSKAEAV